MTNATLLFKILIIWRKELKHRIEMNLLLASAKSNKICVFLLNMALLFDRMNQKK